MSSENIDEHEGSTSFEDEFEAEGAFLEDDEPGFNWGLAAGLIVASIAIGFIIFDGLESETYFYTVDEAVAQGDDLSGQRVRVKGIVEPGTIEGKAGDIGRIFRITEKGKTLRVTYDRAMPDTFKENVEVVVEGDVDGTMTLVADEVLVKCPSRYEGNPPTANEQEEGPRASL